ncbi:beta-galactosidase, partial [Nonomuraea sp. NPDC004297]
AAQESHGDIRVSDRCLWRGGAPWFPITGEMHYSRVPRHRWAEALHLMKAGGVTVVATYVFWIHHQPGEHRPPRFDDRLDVAEFVRLAAATGLDVVLRIGPWCHGEVRNGGHPDWVTGAPYRERTDDPAYLDAVGRWFACLGEQLAPWCGPGGPVIGIQLENELYDQPEHLVTLKELARRSGLRAPLWTATAWGGADLPDGDVFPMYGGYSDGFWVDTHEGWHPTFKEQFAFSDRWDDPGIGADLAGDSRPESAGPRVHRFPPATCELGGGMAGAYHRRIATEGRDVSTVAHCKLGAGSVWQGYYMYVGGANPGPDLQESQATGYPNDLPELNYDFGAPVGAHLQLRDSFHRLRAQHAFVAAFGDRLARMTSTLPHDDDGGVRWALRADDRGGFLFLHTHRPHEPLPAIHGLSFDVELGGVALRVPHVPVDVPSGAAMAWPLLLDLGTVTLKWATATVLTVIDVPGDAPVLVLAAADGVPVHLAVPAGHEIRADGVQQGVDEQILPDVVPSRSFIEIRGPRGRARVLVLSDEDARHAWTPTLAGRRHLVISDADAVVERAGRLTARTTAPAELHVLPPLGTADPAGFSVHRVGADRPAPRIDVELVAAAREPATPVITVPGRAPAPARDTFRQRAAHYRVTVTGPAPADERSLLRLNLVGDVARATFDGRDEDVFWNGAAWDIDITPDRDVDRRVVEVRIYPLTADTPVRFPGRAAARQARAGGPVAAIESAEVLTYRTGVVPSAGR